jgi:hypothetical protein
MNTKYNVSDIVRYGNRDCRVAAIYTGGNQTQGYGYIVEYDIGWGIKSFNDRYKIISGKLNKDLKFHYVSEAYLSLIFPAKKPKPFIYY